MVWCAFCLKKSLASSNHDTIRLKAYESIFFYFKIIKNHGQYGFCIVDLDQFNQSLSKMVCIVFANIFSKFRSGYNKITLEQYCSLKFPW